MIFWSIISNLQENISLSQHTTFRIGGPARFFLAAENDKEVLAAVKFAKENNLKIFVFGGGSNLLVSDQGFDGLVIKLKNRGIKISGQRIIAGAGELFGQVIIESVKNGLAGLEWAVGIPGTMGGAVFGNSGAYGHSISESVKRVRVLSLENLEFRDLSRDQCFFVYRGSVFKQSQEDLIISVELELAAGDSAASQKSISDILRERRQKIPPFPSAGSFFKNYELAEKNHADDQLIKKFPGLTSKIINEKIAAGFLIEQCGLKGARVGGAMVAQEHANFIVNTGGATAADVLALAELCRKKVKEKYGVDLEIEKRLIGF